jgi:hypothetical protein
MTLITAPAAPSITIQPVSQTIVAGKAATFSVTTSGTTPLSYQWNKNGAPISGATSASYKTPNTTALDNGSQFVVIVTNSLSSVTSVAVTLAVNVPPSIMTQPVSQTVIAGQTVIFSGVATGTSPLSYQWKENGSPLSGATLASYTTPVTSAADSGESFTVTVTNAAGSMTSNNAVLTVNVPPSITTQPVSQTVVVGKNAIFSVTVSGTSPLSYQWDKNGARISGATSASYNTPPTTALDNQSQFVVVVTNSAGTLTSMVANLTILMPPSITTQPLSQKVVVGQTATFSVVATVTSPLSYQWMRNGKQIYNATLPSYTTPVTSTSDSGELFTITVTNVAGSVTSSGATLTVSPPVPPSITAQPVSQTVIVGQTATFSVVATGTAPLSYQWTKNGTSISAAASNSYTTPPTTIFDRGELFTVLVGNSGGSATSSAAILAVNTPGQLTPYLSALNFGYVLMGNSSSFAVSVTNSGGSSLTIVSTTVSGAGFTTSGASGQILAPGITTTLAVAFAPAATGTAAGSIVLTSTAANSPTTISLAGMGVQPGFHSVNLEWSESSSNVFGYNVYRATISGGPYALVSLPLVTPSQYLDTVVTAGQSYYYVITAVNSMNNESTYSNELSAIIPTP